MNTVLLILFALPFLAAVPAYLMSRKKPGHGYALLIGVCLVEGAAAASLLLRQGDLTFLLPGTLSMDLHLKADGFRSLYVLVVAFMWLMTSLFTPQYMKHGHNQGRYALFTLLTLGATVGVFLSDDLLTAFLFFEILSFTSYCWVIHEQTAPARRAGQTYLAIAILGGMAMLLGLILLKIRLGTLMFDQLPAAATSAGMGQVFLPGMLVLAGFGAKAGMFPLHVWLPKAHPVAPAPASALLSGVLTKVGIFGILVLSSRLFYADANFGNILLVLGLINMLLGATLGLFSVDLKRTLACSSMSQIGFILLGIGMQNLLGEHNALAAQGTVLHMVNHSLIKLVLFMAAGVIYLNTHSLNLNDIKGYGRKRFGLMAIFLAGAASISGLPFFSGYASKTLLHEAVLEYVYHLQSLGQSAFWYQAAEWLFVIAGGMTFAYMLKLFITIFVQKHPTRQAEYDAMGSSMSPLSALALGGSALVLFGLGLHPEGWLTSLANMALPFLHAHEPAHAVVYLAGINLLGGGKSLLLGLVFFFGLIQTWMRQRDQNNALVYVDRWPKKLDLEDSLYRPVTAMLTRTGMLVASLLGLDFIEKMVLGIHQVLLFLARSMDSLVDGASLLMSKTVLRQDRKVPQYIPFGNQISFHLGRLTDKVVGLIRKMFGLKPLEKMYHVRQFAHIWENIENLIRRMVRTLSFNLVFFALGLVALLAYMLLR